MFYFESELCHIMWTNHIWILNSNFFNHLVAIYFCINKKQQQQVATMSSQSQKRYLHIFLFYLTNSQKTAKYKIFTMILNKDKQPFHLFLRRCKQL